SAPMPRTPRLPGVRISKSRSLSSAPKASRASLSASSTDLPVNSWYSLISASSPSSALTAPLAGADLLVSVGQDGRTLLWGWWWWHRHREAGRMPRRERGRSAEQREHAAPADDQVLLGDREDRGGDPVDEQARRQEATVGDRDQRQEQHHLALDLGVRVVILGPRLGQHHPR